MKFLVSLLASITAVSNSLSTTRQHEFAKFIEKNDWPVSGGVIDVSDLKITDEREGQAFCSFLSNTFESTINAVSPFDFDCSCRLQIFRAQVSFNCLSSVCVSDLDEIAGATPDLPIVGDYCVSPSWGGVLRIIGRRLSSTLCSGSEDLTLNITELEEAVGFDISDDETLTFDLPNVCADVESPEGGDFTSVETCSVTIDGDDCPCEVCSESGQDIRLNCTDVLGKYIPDILDPVLEFTDACIGLSLVTGGDDNAREEGNPSIVGPLLQIKEL